MYRHHSFYSWLKVSTPAKHWGNDRYQLCIIGFGVLTDEADIAFWTGMLGERDDNLSAINF